MHNRKDFELFGKAIKIENIKQKDNIHIGEYEGKPIYIISADESTDGDGYFKTAAMIEREGGYIPIAVPAEKYGTPVCYECNVLHLMGDNFLTSDKFFPKFEKTGGSVMFTKKDGQRKYLLIKNESGHIGFPKGHIEYGESEEETAKREVFEETGLDFIKFGDFRHEYTYQTKENCVKTGVFFISEYEYKAPKIQEEEILDDWLLTYDKAIELLNFPQDRELLKKADRYITDNKK